MAEPDDQMILVFTAIAQARAFGVSVRDLEICAKAAGTIDEFENLVATVAQIKGGGNG